MLGRHGEVQDKLVDITEKRKCISWNQAISCAVRMLVFLFLNKLQKNVEQTQSQMPMHKTEGLLCTYGTTHSNAKSI